MAEISNKLMVFFFDDYRILHNYTIERRGSSGFQENPVKNIWPRGVLGST